MDDREFIEEQKAALRASIHSFRAGNNWEMEKWTVGVFLRNSGIPYSQDEIVPADEPADAVFRNASFQVKEILDEGRRRGDEYKRALARMKKIGKAEEAFTLGHIVNLSLSQLIEKVEGYSFKYEKKYPASSRARLDLLVYVNLLNVFEILVDCPVSSERLKNANWRSVSFTNGSYAGVIHAAPEAPQFINNRIGKLSHRWHHKSSI